MMRNLCFEDYEGFAYEITDKLESICDEFDDVSVIAKYEDAKKLITELLYIGYDIASIELHKEDFDEYWDEYIVGITSDEVWCEKFKRGDEYINAVSNMIYVMDNCSSKVIPHCQSDNVYEVHIGEDDKNDFGKCNCKACDTVNNDTNTSESTYISKAKDGTPLGFSKTWSTSEDGINCYSSYSCYSDNIDILRENAEIFDIEL